MDYETFRREYTAGGLRREMLQDCPLQQFELWLQQAVDANLVDPTAMVLATVDADGQPWQRIVLFKGLSAGGLVFYTNYDSAKGRAIAVDPQVSLLFPWNVLDRQVIVRGRAEKVSREMSAAYFASRPWDSQVAAWASRQSETIDSRDDLAAQAQTVNAQYADVDLPLPEFWGGYRVVPDSVEFWQGGRHRLHDRFRYLRQQEGQWRIVRLQP